MKVVLLLCVTLAVASAKCPNGWTLAEDICILIIDQPFTFLQASNECESRGGSLMSMRSRKDELLLLSVALKTHQPHLKVCIMYKITFIIINTLSLVITRVG